MSTALPFLRCPETLVNCRYAGNAGFDPLGFASSAEQLAEYREAEIKHARLAMLVRARWPSWSVAQLQVAADGWTVVLVVSSHQCSFSDSCVFRLLSLFFFF